MIQIDDKSALVLEGGGMRGIFTCGVLDYLMDNKISFPYSVGVWLELVTVFRICRINEGEGNTVT